MNRPTSRYHATIEGANARQRPDTEKADEQKDPGKDHMAHGIWPYERAFDDGQRDNVVLSDGHTTLSPVL